MITAYLVELKADETDSKSSGSSNSRNDLSSNQLGLVLISLCDLVIGSSEVGGSSDEIDMVVGIVILLKVDWL